MSKLIPKHQKGNYMQTSTGKVANFQLPEVEVTAESPTGDAWKDRNLYKAYKGRRYINEGRQSIAPLIQNTASLSPIGDIMDAVEIGKNINGGNYGQAALGAGLFLLPNILEKPLKKLIPRKVLKELSLEDVKNWTDKDWDANYSKAIKEGNNDKVQRIRDLHFNINAPNTKIIDDKGNPLKVYHGSDNHNITIFNNKLVREHMNDNRGAIFTTDSYDMAQRFANQDYNLYERFFKNKKGKVYSLYSNIEKPLNIDYKGLFWNDTPAQLPKKYTPNNEGWIRYGLDNNQDGTIFYNIKDAARRGSSKSSNNIVPSLSNQIKSADAVTYDDSGNIIPISKRDNFNSPDIRYGLIPLIGFGTYKQYNKEND